MRKLIPELLILSGRHDLYCEHQQLQCANPKGTNACAVMLHKRFYTTTRDNDISLGPGEKLGG